MRFVIPMLLAAAAAAARAERIAVVVSTQAEAAERTAAAELAVHLAKIYPGDRFEVAADARPSGKTIFIGAAARGSGVAVPADPEGFVAGAKGEHGYVLGGSPRGVLHGVYALLEKLGWGFYLSHDAAPAPRAEPFSFNGWTLADRPVFGDRVVFQWHNFLSSASTWELEDWQRWIDGASRMRYNTVMIHAYGNNPMWTFSHNGQAKPVGYLATTVRGRDWGTQHVNDVRRLAGGSIFRAPEFGSAAGLAVEERRVEAAQALTGKALAYARSRGLHAAFALDVDTASANPQNIVLTLPESARFPSGNLQLPNPDTPEGYAYFKSQARRLFELYPQVDRLVIWFRAQQTPWRAVKAEEFPAAWRELYAAALDRSPAMRTNQDAPSMFAIGRIAAAFSRALREMGRKDVELGCGTWHAGHLPAAHVFFEPSVKLYWLDWNTTFDQPDIQRLIRSIPQQRAMLPIVWAHHDDRTYIGRPYKPYGDFVRLVQGAGTGFGIIHWTTRPLDLYFKSLSEQSWSSTVNRPLKETLRDFATRSFGPGAAARGAAYLEKWLDEGRMFGRETTDRFIDVPLADAAEVIARSRERIRLLDGIDGENAAYFRGYEKFTAAFFETHAAYESALALHKAGKTAAARQAAAAADPKAVIEQYVEAARHGGITRGEQALAVSLNLRWLPYIVSLRQALGMEPVRYKFGPTRHELLAQSSGRNTFWVDSKGSLWKVLGEKETGVPVAEVSSRDEFCASGLRLRQPLTLTLAAPMGDQLAPGRYRARLYPPSSRPVEVELDGGKAAVHLEPAAAGAVVCGIEIVLDEAAR